MTKASLQEAWPLVKKNEARIVDALASTPDAGLVTPVGIKPWMVALRAEFERQPKLCQAMLQCPDTVIECMSVAAGLGLVPGGSAGQFYLIPRKDRNRGGKMTCTFIVGYKGLSELAYRHPRVHKIEAWLVMEGDEFDWNPGRDVHHKFGPSDRIVTKDMSNVIGAYARTVLTVQGSTHVATADPVVEYLTIAELRALRKRSASERAGAFGPWQSDPGRMLRKGPIRRTCNGGSVPQSPSLVLGLAQEDKEERRLEAELEASIDPTTTAVNSLRAAAGLDEKKPTLELPHFDFVEEAVEFVRTADAETLAEMTLGEFKGGDADILKRALEEREAELRGDDG